MANPLKLLFTYEIEPEKGDEYLQFALSTFVPALQRMGLEMSEAWGTLYGNGPMRMIGFVCADENTLWDAMQTDQWLELTDKLQEFVYEYEYKVIPYKAGFQI